MTLEMIHVAFAHKMIVFIRGKTLCYSLVIVDVILWES